MYHLGYPILESVAQPAIKSRGGGLACVYMSRQKGSSKFYQYGGHGNDTWAILGMCYV